MNWSVKEEHEFEIIREIEVQPDRGAAIIAASFVEERLCDAVRARLVQDTSTHFKLADALLKGRGGALATFAAKIDVGLLLGLYESETHSDLHTIRDIRNEFAHRMVPLSFDSQSIAEKCAALRLPDHFPLVASTITSEAELLPNIRGRYLRSIQILLRILLEAKM